MTLISSILGNAICEQISHELYNSNLYLYMCGFLRNKGLGKLAGIFEKQVDEEREHSKIFFDLLTDLSYPVTIPEINPIAIDFPSIVSIAESFLSREISTTNSINAIKKMAIEEDNPVVEECMRKMIKKQQAEYAEATDFMDNAMLCSSENTNESWWKAKVWNDAME